MAKIRILLLFFIMNQSLTAQNLRNFKTKNEANTTERTYMLDLLRAEVREEISQKVVIVVNHFIVSGVYAWIEGSAQLKDGSKPKMPYTGMDCCQVDALYKRVNGKWVLKESGAFSTDVWYYCIQESYKDVDMRIFQKEKHDIIMCN